MMQKMLVAASLALAVAQVSAIAAPSSPFGSLFPRQDPSGLDPNSIPAACQGPCASIESTINTCQDLTCLCTNSVAAQITSCVNCLVAVGGDSSGSLLSQGQSIVDQFTNACDTSGEPVSSIKVSSVAPTGTAAGGGSQTTVATGGLPTGTQSIGFSSPGAGGGTGSVLPPVVSNTGSAGGASGTSTGGLNPTGGITGAGSGAAKVGASAAAALVGVAVVFVGMM